MKHNIPSSVITDAGRLIDQLFFLLSGNACETGTHTCDKDAECLSTRRRYRCRCKQGYYGTGKICVGEYHYSC